MAWTDDRILLLRQYWDEGKSASQIAELLGDGLTRNAVIGKAHRMGLSSRPSPLKPAKDGKAANKSAPRKAAPPKPKAAATAPAAAAPVAEAAPLTPPPPAPAPAPVSAPASAPRAEPVKAAEAGPEPEPQRIRPPLPSTRPLPPQPPAVTTPPRPVVAARNDKDGKVTLLDLNDRICKWPNGHPDEADFHFCGRPVSPGFPYCGDHCLQAYQAQMPRRDRTAGPPRPFGPNLPRPR